MPLILCGVCMIVKGDVMRLRRLGSSDAEWCVGRVIVVSPNEDAVGLEIDGLLRVDGGVMLQAVGFIVRDGRAYEVFTDTELEVECAKVTIH